MTTETMTDFHVMTVLGQRGCSEPVSALDAAIEAGAVESIDGIEMRVDMDALDTWLEGYDQ